MLVQQFQLVVDDRVLGFGEQVRLRKGRLRNAGTRVFLATLVDDGVQVLLGAEAHLFQQFDNRRNLSHVGDGRLFDGHAVAFGALVAHLDFGFHSRASCCASAIWAGVMRSATSSRLSAASF